MPLRRRRGKPGSDNVGVHRSVSSDGVIDLLAAGASWHREIVQAAHTGDWERLERLWMALRRQDDRHHMLLQQQQQKSFWSSPKRASRRTLQRHQSADSTRNSLWNRITHRGSGAPATPDSSRKLIDSDWQQLEHTSEDAVNFNQSPSKIRDDPICSNDVDVTNYSHDTDDFMHHDGSMGLLSVDEEFRTPLHLLLTVPTSPTWLILNILKQEPRAATQQTMRGRLPLHLAIVHRAEDTEILEALVEAFPAAISVSDRSGRQLTPLQYAMEFAIEAADEECDDDGNENVLPPRTYWAPHDNDDNVENGDDASFFKTESVAAIWQKQQSARWSTVQWLLMASATHAQTCLSIGGRKPMLVDALLHAAPPVVVQLLLGASISLLSHQDAATAFAGTTLYTCIARHYPLSILQNLASQCPRDAASTRDATGTGLVAALYITGCFDRTNARTQEWTVVDDFVEAMGQMVQTGRFPRNNCNTGMLRDWWGKMEFLLAFCAHRKPKACSSCDETEKSWHFQDHDQSSPTLKQFLLHSALTNSDVPPLVIRLLLALYPSSIHRPDPVSGAWPLHMVAQCREYIPKSFEVMASLAHRQKQKNQQQSTDSDIFGDRRSALETILDADPRAVLRRHNDRLPLHYAISSGRQIETVEPLLKQAKDLLNFNRHRHILLQRDPETGLFPFQLAACFQPNEEDNVRWTCIARNQYTNAVWQGLGEKHKATAVTKVVQRENLGHLDTVYELLRRLPCVISVPEHMQQSHHCQQNAENQQQRKGAPRRRSNDSTASSSSSLENSVGENVTVRSFYLDWCFTTKDTISATRVHAPNKENQRMLVQAIQFLNTTGSHNLLPDSFNSWWTTMKVCLRNECRLDKYPMFGRLTMGRRMTIPVRREEFLLHAALANFETPPNVIEIILAFDWSASSLYLPGTFLLPLHIVAGTPSYVPRTYESVEKSSLQLVLQKHPAAVRVACLGRLPLHLAILAKRPFHEVRLLVNEERRSLKKKDPRLGLFPFLLAASQQDGESSYVLTMQEQQSQLVRLAQNQKGVRNWDSLGAKERLKFIERAQADSELDHLSTVYFLLRQDVSMLVDNFDVLALKSSLNVTNRHCHSSVRFSKQNAEVQASLSMSTIGKEEGNDESMSSSSEILMSRRESSLMLLLKPSRGKAQEHDEVYECDASVISMVDILSSLNSTINKSSRDDGTLTSEDSKDSSVDGLSFAHADDEITYDEFAEDTDAETTCAENETKETERMKDSDDTDLLVIFEIRKVSRFSLTKVCLDEGAGFSEMLSSHPSENFSRVPDIQSFTAQNAKGHPSDKSVASSTSRISGKSTLQSEPSRFSFRFAGSEKPGLTDMMWMSPDLLQPRILTEPSQREEDETRITLALPPKPSSLHSKPAAISGVSSTNTARRTSRQCPSNHSKGSKTRSSLLGDENKNSDEEEEDDDGINLAFFQKPTHLNDSLAHAINYEADNLLDASAKWTDRTASISARSNKDVNISTDLLHESDSSFQANKVLGANMDNASSDSASALGINLEQEQSKHVGAGVYTDEAANDGDFVGMIHVLDTAESCHIAKPYIFDRVAFKWTIHTMNQEVETVVRSNSENLIAANIHEMTFDRKLMRWVTKPSLKEEEGTPGAHSSISGTLLESTTLNESHRRAMHSLVGPLSRRKTRKQGTVPTRRLTKPGARPKRRKGSAVGMHELAQNRMNCLLCDANPREVLMVPCRHLCICRRCSVKEDNITQCPLCKCAVAGRMLIF